MDESIRNFEGKFNEVKEPIRVVSHLDADGLSSAAIVIKALQRENREFNLTIVRQLDETALKELSVESYNVFLFCDLGSGQLSLISKHLKGKKIFILDHHIPEDHENDFVHVNPHLEGHSSWDYSGACLCYLFAKKLNEKNKDLSYIAVIGGLGDHLDFTKGALKTILDDSVSLGKIEVKKGLRMFGTQTRSLVNLLQYSTDPYIPGVTGDYEGAAGFLGSLGIDIKKNGEYIKLKDLDDRQMKDLIAGVIIKRFGSEEDPEDVIGNIYLLKDEDEESYTKDAKEFATLLNACGRLKNFSVGIGVLLGNIELKKEANDIMKEYKSELIKAMNWFYSNKDRFEKGGNYMIINAHDSIKDSLIGTLSGMILANSGKRGFIIVGMAETHEGEIKVSLRTNSDKIDLREIINKIADGGGHSKACGAYVKKENEDEFIRKIKEELNNLNSS
ncbi:DHH family phosphoesterase [Candidatus Woesearchaeota archaeon]|nr:DHH family phosphoesterase [Candidatus Woesearchaeota archaeon]